ncbi:MAG TPA: L-threonylcarbamoyladenylate synthase [Candidatus Humimicrobiaceae bacterium]
MSVIKIKNSGRVSGETVRDIACYILNEKAIILPAKTIYGLSCMYNSKPALKKLYKIKERKSDLPFIILFSKLKNIEKFAEDIGRDAGILIKHYWDCEEPAPLTIIFKINASLEDFITGGRDTIALRRAELKFVRDVIDASTPIVSTSATISQTDVMPHKLKDIPEKILKKADLVVELEEELLGIESTIVDASGSEIRLVREGAVKFGDILQKLQIKI